jgi:hypothetical protein
MNARPDYAPLFYWVRERESIRRRKELGLAPESWTTDPILSTWRFCNVRREDDRGTVWIRENIRERFAGHPHLWFMLCIARQVNWPDTLAALIDANAWPNRDTFEPRMVTAILNQRKAKDEKVYTGAYMISAPSTKGADKQAYIAETVCGALWSRRDVFAKHFAGAATLQRTHELIMIELIVDSFAGGGGASTGIEIALAARPTSRSTMTRPRSRCTRSTIPRPSI